MSTATFDTRDYYRSHGRQPRGVGVWAFAPSTTNEYAFSRSMTYSAAKAWAREEFPDARSFVVGP